MHLTFLGTGDVTLTIGGALTQTGSRAIDDIFNFLSNSHVLVVVDSSVLDRESIDRYVFTVVATDSAGLTSTANVTINILDFNDETPRPLNDG